MRSFLGSGLFVLLMLLLDWYVFQAVRVVSIQSAIRWKMILYAVYWIISAITVLSILALPVFSLDQWPRILRTYVFAIIIGLFLSKLVAAVFFMADDLRRGIQWAGGKLYYQFLAGEDFRGAEISRSVFLSWLGLGLGSGLFGALLWGFRNKYNYKVERLQLRFDNLPEAFRGLKVIHISDIHSGSLSDKTGVEKGLSKILEEKPDLILFTGDLVNDRVEEMHGWEELFGGLSAPFGVFSTLGNHDYGDYRSWPNPAAKAENLENLKKLQQRMGWRLLMNEHVVLEKDGHQLALIGIENWSAKANFPKYGRMEDAYPGAAHHPFKILMSHDPSHWDGEVREKYPDIDLMLSGHTHGMQFGVELPGFRWSPVQYVYKQWAGLYEHGKQKLYVNRGFGFLGYPGRVGILPEITVIELI